MLPGRVKLRRDVQDTPFAKELMRVEFNIGDQEISSELD